MKASEAIETYISLRDEIAQKKKAHEAEIAPLKERMDKIEAKFLEAFNRMGTDNMSVRGVGTAFRSTKTSASVADKESFMEFVKDGGNWHLLEVRAAKTAVDEYVSRHETPPPGVNYNTMVSVNFQRSHAK